MAQSPTKIIIMNFCVTVLHKYFFNYVGSVTRPSGTLHLILNSIIITIRHRYTLGFSPITLITDTITISLGFTTTKTVTTRGITSVKLAAYSHSAADSPKKVRVQKHPQKS